MKAFEQTVPLINEPSILDLETKYRFNFIDLFAGIGGFHIAMANLGGTCVFASEWDDNARKTYTENFYLKSPLLFNLDKTPTTNFAGDITKVNPQDVPNHDILCGGFPCQPFSQAGFKKGFEDTRGTLFFNVCEIIKTKQPKAFFLENVNGLFKHDNGKTFKVIQNAIDDLGYNFYYKIVKASDFNLPQHRPRLYMIGIRKDLAVDYVFPEPLKLAKSMSDIFEGAQVNKKIGFTLRVGGKCSPITDRRNWDGYLVNGELRRIKPKEGKRMQGFPEDYIFPVSDSIAMKQLGNSVAITAIQATAKELLKVLNSIGMIKNA
ncbi:MAG: DNA cytosine methyltransferase [Bacillales bacterium]|nr:DNA cytosine methyltransferase [Bacillales bacterium]